ncbi:RNA recognition motif a.k.a RRM RBD or RNP domain protein [Aspergillus parasiticus SU-1]|uniref:RRM domain-containing protein n=2 Tax=Aspergillus parasiticus TaxID=5067 RepID=A0A5N6DCU2_ASPPA|nr:hypothetical protein BDV34DRAFT_215026 [Aspergillus parasiticus]KJK67950.1 RNA recognition motif a.k.a RRM RBD or RNP domain protein [Aspergillus parasiticus SU-1]
MHNNVTYIGDMGPSPQHPNHNEPQLTFEEVQQIYGKDARLFVGNLSVNVDQSRLMRDLHEAFRPFGACCVGLKYSRTRQGLQIPGAFVQYERPEYAQAALSLDRQHQLHNRLLRVERAAGQRNRSANGSPPYHQMPQQWCPPQRRSSFESTLGSYENPYMAGAPGPYPPVWGEQSYPGQVEADNVPIQEQAFEGQVEHQQGSAAATWNGPLIVDGSYWADRRRK